MVKKGDTLIEVALAIGIFSMVAISVVTVMVGGVSSTQTALETTLAREEIDTQAEALRFIHASYISDSTDDNPFTRLWKKITDNAYILNNNTPSHGEGGYNIATPIIMSDKAYLQYAPSSCDGVYSSSAIKDGFIINTYALGTLTSDSPDSQLDNIYYHYPLSEAVKNIFKKASTYPRLVYQSVPENLSDNSESYTLKSIEGIYVLAVKDPGTTNTVSNEKGAAYYDFYIRTCWYGTGSETPSTISTVIRLYDPEGIKE